MLLKLSAALAAGTDALAFPLPLLIEQLVPIGLNVLLTHRAGQLRRREGRARSFRSRVYWPGLG